MQRSFDKYVDYVSPDCMAKSGGRSGSKSGTAGDNGEGLRGNSFTGPSRSLEPAAGMIWVQGSSARWAPGARTRRRA